MLRLRAPAKINLTLEVLGRRKDGYHEVRTVLQAIDLSDELSFEPSQELVLRVDPIDAAPTEDNLVLKAAMLLRARSGCGAGASIHLQKRIPTGAGLGGGSSDAAIALLGLCRLWELELELDELTDIASQIGSDVPFFLSGGTALASGRGDHLAVLPLPVESHAVIVDSDNHKLENKTRQMYGQLTPSEYSDGGTTADVVHRLHTGARISDQFTNVFETAAMRMHDAYDAMHLRLAEVGLDRFGLCGSGPAVFGLFMDERAASGAANRIQNLGYRVFITRLLSCWSPTELEIS